MLFYVERVEFYLCNIIARALKDAMCIVRTKTDPCH